MTDEASNNDLSARADRIRDLVKVERHCIIEIGRELLAARERIHSERPWEDWLQAEFKWNERRARRYMEIAKVYRDVPVDAATDAASSVTINMDMGALRVLAAPDVPQEVRDDAIARSSKGEHINRRKALDIVQESRRQEAPTVPAPSQDARPTPHGGGSARQHRTDNSEVLPRTADEPSADFGFYPPFKFNSRTDARRFAKQASRMWGSNVVVGTVHLAYVQKPHPHDPKENAEVFGDFRDHYERNYKFHDPAPVAEEEKEAAE